MSASSLTAEQIEATKNFRRAFSHIATPNTSISARLTPEQQQTLSAYCNAFGLKQKDKWNTTQLPQKTSEEELKLVENFKTKLKTDGALQSEEDKAYASDIRLLQYIRARDSSLDKAYTMLLETLVWRREEQPWKMENVASRTDKTCADARIVGFDVKDRVVVYSSFANTTRRTPKDVQINTSAMMEKAALCQIAGSPGNLMWINHFGSRHKNGFGLGDCNPAFFFAGIDVFNKHYPECLNVMIVVDPPAMFFTLWSVIKPVIPQKTQDKAMFINSREVDKNRQQFNELFGAELTEFLLDNIEKDAE